MEIKVDVKADLSKPLLRLIEVSANAVGTMYQDTIGADLTVRRQIKLAEAEKAIKLIKADTENELLIRSQRRFLLQEARRQLNIEDVIQGAITHLPETVSEEKPTEDWTTSFFNIAQDISDDDMKAIWSKILAGEITRPGTYSKRTLETLKNLSQHEARTFVKLMSFTFGNYVIFKLGNDTGTLNPFGFTFADWKTVQEAGLVSIPEDLRINASTPTPLFRCGNKTVMFHTASSSSIEMQIKQLTKVGTELSQLIEVNPNEAYLSALGEYYKQKGVNVVVASI